MEHQLVSEELFSSTTAQMEMCNFKLKWHLLFNVYKDANLCCFWCVSSPCAAAVIAAFAVPFQQVICF